MTTRHKAVHLRNFRELLEAYQPDVIHFQHTLFLGYDLFEASSNYSAICADYLYTA